jgi:GT2 family glycosyltransferase
MEPVPASEHRISIPPVPAGISRPTWSVMIPVYNSARYLRQALESVLSQDPGRDVMQIEVVDDASEKDNPQVIVQELGGGRVEFFRQAHNVGHTRNFDTCLQRARGRLVHILHGDDCVLPGFYQTLQPAFDQHPEIGAAFCRFVVLDEHGRQTKTWPLEQPEPGILPGWLEKIAAGQRLQTPAMVVRREVYEHLGGFDRRIRAYGEDWEMWVRIAAAYPVWYEPQALAAYRTHASSLSGSSFRTGDNVRDLLRVIDIIQEYLPEEKAGRLAKIARQNNAEAAIRRSHRALEAGDFRAPLAQLRAALQSSTSPRVLARSVGLLFHWSWRFARYGLFGSRPAS